MTIRISLGRFAADLRAALASKSYERTDDGGLYLPKSRAFIGGVFRHAAAGADGVFGPWATDPNRVVSQGLDYILNAAFGETSPIGQFYLAPFAGNVTPAANWTAANFTSNSTEFTAYTAGTRLPWNTAASTAQAIGNSADVAAATLTLNVGGPYNLYGVGLLSASAKSSTSGVLVAATRFAVSRTNMAGGDKLALEYVISAKDEADA